MAGEIGRVGTARHTHLVSHSIPPGVQGGQELRVQAGSWCSLHQTSEYEIEVNKIDIFGYDIIVNEAILHVHVPLRETDTRKPLDASPVTL